MPLQLRGINALEYWAKKATAGYKGVEIRDMTRSWSDGLAFCAIIHRYRSDLLNWHALSHENGTENCHLAFSVAEKELGIPALLDAKDMCNPDRLSVVTYVAQLFHYFNEKQPEIRLRTPEPREESVGVHEDEGAPLAKMEKMDQEFEPAPPPPEEGLCSVCGRKVFVLERLILDDKLLHRDCFRCEKCRMPLKIGLYLPTERGSYECMRHELEGKEKISLKKEDKKPPQTTSKTSRNILEVNGRRKSTETLTDLVSERSLGSPVREIQPEKPSTISSIRKDLVVNELYDSDSSSMRGQSPAPQQSGEVVADSLDHPVPPPRQRRQKSGATSATGTVSNRSSMESLPVVKRREKEVD